MGLVGDYRLHDSVIKKIDITEDKVKVQLRTMDKETLILTLTGVKSIDRYKADDMFIYSVIKEEAAEGHINVTFVNWHSEEEEGGDSKLEVLCKEWKLEEGTHE